MSYAAAVLLAAVFAWAGAAKLRRPRETEAGFASLGLPAPRALSVAVPVLELALAAALLVVPAPGAFAALGLLGLFTGVLAAALGRDTGAGCGCFGSASQRPVSFVELVRNGLLAVAALAACSSNGPEVPNLEEVIVVATAAAVGLVILGLCQLRRDVGRLWGPVR